MTWHPITTAPRDGSPILFWSEAHGYFAGNQPPNCSAGRWSMIGSRWCGSSDKQATEATHWCRPPEPPKVAT